MTQPYDQTFKMRVSAEWMADIDRWRATQWNLPSRAEAIRTLVVAALAVHEVAIAESGADAFAKAVGIIRQPGAASFSVGDEVDMMVDGKLTRLKIISVGDEAEIENFAKAVTGDNPIDAIGKKLGIERKLGESDAEMTDRINAKAAALEAG
jgi:hypothetical protein